MRPRTKRQREIFDYIQEFAESHGHDPSYQQIAVSIGVSSKSGIAKHIKALEDQGLLVRRRINGHFRLELNPPETFAGHIISVAWLRLPECLLDTIPGFKLVIPASMAGAAVHSKLRGVIVPDNAMKDEHILQGDIALVERREFARDRDCVVALIDDETLILSNFRRAGADIEFIPANQSYDRQKFSADRVQILGVFKSLLRPPE